MLTLLVESGAAAERAGAWDEALAHYETAFQRTVAEGGDAASTAELLRRIGTVHRQRGALELAIEVYAASLAVAEASGLTGHVAAAVNCLGVVEQLRGEMNRAESLYTRARALAAEADDRSLIAMVDLNLGTLSNIWGDVAAALASYRSALEHSRRTGDDLMAARTLNNVGMAHVDLAEWEHAEGCFHEALELAERAGDTLMVGAIELNRAELYLKRQRFEQARAGCDRALHIFNRLKAKRWTGEAYKFYGILYRETGKPDQADAHFALALGLAEVCQDRLLEAEAQLEWALLQIVEGRRQDAVVSLNRALCGFMALQARREVLDMERRLERLKELYLPTIEQWVNEITAPKDCYQVGQAQRVAQYSGMLARELGLSGWDLTWLHVGALIRDMGNTAVPAEVLGKAEVLTREERELVQVHTIMGDAMVSQMHFPAEIRPMVRNHHEHWAGTGYPDRLAGDAIPLPARILCVADVYTALTSPRSYRPAFPSDEALRIMARDAGRVFDPKLFECFKIAGQRDGWADGR